MRKQTKIIVCLSRLRLSVQSQTNRAKLNTTSVLRSQFAMGTSYALYILLALLLLALLGGCVLFVRHRYAYFRRHNIPYTTPTFPLGNAQELGSELAHSTWIKKLYFLFRGRASIGGLFIGVDPVVLVTDLNVIRDVMVNQFCKFTNRSFYMNERDDPLSAMLIAMKGERWRNLRTKMSPTFSVTSTRRMFETVHSVGQNLLAFVQRFVVTSEPFSSKNIAMRYICDTIGLCGFGLECQALTQQDPYLLTIANNLFPISRFLMKFWLLAGTYPRLAHWLRLKAFPTFVTRYFRRVIEETVQYREDNNIKLNDFMNLMIDIKNRGCLTEDESGEVLGTITYEELQAQAFMIFAAGFQTSRIALTFALFELAMSGTIQTRARDEVLANMTDGQVTYESLGQMVYLQQVIDGKLLSIG